MEDLASFIQTLSEKYGLLDFGNDKVDSTVNGHFQQKYAPTAAEEQDEHGQENGDGLGVDSSWECLTSFLNKHELQYNNMRNFRTKKSSVTKRRERNGELPHDNQADDDVEEAQTLNRTESGSSDRAVSIANTMQTSDMIQNASFLDELQNPSLSEDLQSTGMTKGRDSLDDIDHGQSSLSQEILSNNGEKDLDVTEFAKEMGLSNFNECPQKEDAPWNANSDAWFREFCETRYNVGSSSQRSVRMDTKAAKEVCLDRGLLAHDILASNIILLSSGGSSSPTGTELDGQVDDCHSASASQCGTDSAIAKSRCASPEGFAAALESVERGRERAAIINARVEKMLEKSDSHHRRPVHQPGETAAGKSISGVREINHDPEDTGNMSEFQFGTSENGSVGSLKKRMAEMGEGNRLLLTQLDKSRSLLSPSKQPTLFRSRSSASDRSESCRQTRRSSEEVGDRSEHDDNVPLKQLHGGGSMMLSSRSQEKVPSPHGHDPLSRASSRRERDYNPDSRASSIQEEEDGAKASSRYPGQGRASSRNQDVDHQPIIASPVDQPHRKNMKRDSSGDQHIGRNLRIRIPNFQLPADLYDHRNADGQDLLENQEDIYSSRKTLTQDHQNECNGSLALSPRNKQTGDNAEIREGREKIEAAQPSLVHSGHIRPNDEGFCSRTKEYFNFTSAWGNDWTEVEEEVIEPTTDSTPSRASADQSKWERVNNLLCQNGFPAIRSSNAPASGFREDCLLVLSDVMTNYERREKLVQALLEEGDELRQVEERNHLQLQQLESERDEAKQKFAASEQRADVAAKAAERNYAALRRDCQKLESSNANLMQRCSQLEHACRAKERTLQKLQDKVRESMVKEDRHRNNDKEVYERLKHKVASAQHTNGEVLEPNFLQRDLKPAQIVGIYERQKVTLETEISNLRAENAQLCREICEKENIILNKVLGTEETKKALELLSHKQQLEIDEKVTEINRLEDELKERPTMEEVEETIRRQEEESRQFHERAQEESYFEKILRQICQLLELEEPSFIVETLESLLVLVSAVPRMEQFVSDVCDVVFCDGQNWSPPSNDEDAGANRTPEAVPGILKSWLQKLEESSEQLAFKDTIVSMLWQRAEMKNSELEPEMSSRVVIGCVKNLIEFEQDYLATKEAYRGLTSDAGAIVKAEPQKLLHRIVAHFQMLFEVPKLEGVMTVMNSVYIKCTEYHNFAKALSSMLGLDKEEGPNAIIATVNSIMSNGRA